MGYKQDSRSTPGICTHFLGMWLGGTVPDGTRHPDWSVYAPDGCTRPRNTIHVSRSKQGQPTLCLRGSPDAGAALCWGPRWGRSLHHGLQRTGLPFSPRTPRRRRASWQEERSSRRCPAPVPVPGGRGIFLPPPTGIVGSVSEVFTKKITHTKKRLVSTGVFVVFTDGAHARLRPTP